MPPEPAPIPWGQILFFCGCAAMLIIAFLLWMRSKKKASYYRQHVRKTERGLRIIHVEKKGWSDGVDWLVTYSDQSTITITDEFDCPLWAKSPQ